MNGKRERIGTRLSGGRSAISGSASKVLEECCGELEPSEEEFDIFSWRLRFSLEEKSEKYKRNEG